jgi:hypothetical protein
MVGATHKRRVVMRYLKRKFKILFGYLFAFSSVWFDGLLFAGIAVLYNLYLFKKTGKEDAVIKYHASHGLTLVILGIAFGIGTGLLGDYLESLLPLPMMEMAKVIYQTEGAFFGQFSKEEFDQFRIIFQIGVVLNAVQVLFIVVNAFGTLRQAFCLATREVEDSQYEFPLWLTKPAVLFYRKE